METKYYTLNILDTKKMRKERRRKKILRNRIKCACGVIGITSFFYLLGVVGGHEQGMLTNAEFWMHSIIALGLMFISIKADEIV